MYIHTTLFQGGSDLSYSDPTTGKTPLHYAAEMRNAAIIELLLRSGAPLDVLDMNGLTPVHTAAIIEGQEALSAIAKVVGSDVLNLPDARGLTPLMHACTYGNETSVKFLLKRKVHYKRRHISTLHTDAIHELMHIMCNELTVYFMS